MGYWIRLSGVYGGEKMGRTRGTGTQRYRLFMWIATAFGSSRPSPQSSIAIRSTPWPGSASLRLEL